MSNFQFGIPKFWFYKACVLSVCLRSEMTVWIRPEVYYKTNYCAARIWKFLVNESKNKYEKNSVTKQFLTLKKLTQWPSSCCVFSSSVGKTNLNQNSVRDQDKQLVVKGTLPRQGLDNISLTDSSKCLDNVSLTDVRTEISETLVNILFLHVDIG